MAASVVVLITTRLPELLADILAGTLAHGFDVRRVEAPLEPHALLAAADRADADVVVAEWVGAHDVAEVLRGRPATKLSTVAADGRTTSLWQRSALGSSRASSPRRSPCRCAEGSGGSCPASSRHARRARAGRATLRVSCSSAPPPSGSRSATRGRTSPLALIGQGHHAVQVVLLNAHSPRCPRHARGGQRSRGGL